ncbi:MAG: hypothetical protein OXU54_01025 [Gammaproteobacteria bacterium]|nr:hypothetical protein [Gammaproteobacteria bacterium]
MLKILKDLIGAHHPVAGKSHANTQRKGSQQARRKTLPPDFFRRRREKRRKAAGNGSKARPAAGVPLRLCFARRFGRGLCLAFSMLRFRLSGHFISTPRRPVRALAEDNNPPPHIPQKEREARALYTGFLLSQEWRGGVYSLDAHGVFAQPVSREWRMRIYLLDVRRAFARTAARE